MQWTTQVYTFSELQIRRALKTIKDSFFLFLNENIHCDTSLEPSQEDMKGHNVCFYGAIRKIIPFTPSYLDHCYLPTSLFTNELYFLLPQDVQI